MNLTIIYLLAIPEKAKFQKQNIAIDTPKSF